MDIRAVNQITEILREHGGTLVTEEWQTLKAAVLGTTTNMPTTPCEVAASCPNHRCRECRRYYEDLYQLT